MDAEPYKDYAAAGFDWDELDGGLERRYSHMSHTPRDNRIETKA